MNKKYELTNETKEINGYVLHRIKALKDFNNVKAGDIGGWIEKEDNLSHDGNCWVYDNACVFGNAHVYCNARIYSNAHVYGNAYVYGDVYVYDNARVYNNTCVCGNARVYGNAQVYDDACVCGNACVYGNSYIYGNAQVYDDACVYGDVHVYGYACVYNDANIKSKFDIISFNGFGTEARTTTAYRCKDNLIKIKCGCFNGALEEFRKQIKETRKGKYAEEYLLIADVIERHFREE